MTRPICIFAVFICCSCSQPGPPAQSSSSAPPVPPQPPKWGRVIHTGAGNFTLDGLAARKDAMQAAMNDALMAGYPVPPAGGTRLHAVQRAIAILEASP